MQISLASAEIHLLLYANCWDEGVRDHTQILIFEHLCMCICLSVGGSCHSMYMAVRIQLWRWSSSPIVLSVHCGVRQASWPVCF